ncbi:glycosyltransferase family 4 protein [Rhodococcus sp. X156]|uniref:glycosyltransferase family 4 protein n=1 Tax=Rhodococcus sp. X156 TaxID=2499145 RepID=UPI000FD6C202|nr:glycosyltransferase family 4 protein [Rhodococcus sp. X156]
MTLLHTIRRYKTRVEADHAGRAEWRNRLSINLNGDGRETDADGSRGTDKRNGSQGTTTAALGHGRRIVLAVTAAQSLKLMTGFPEHLAGRGWEVHVVANDCPASLYSENIIFHQVRMSREPAPLRDARALFAWTRLLYSLKPDLVVSGTPKAGLLGMLAAYVTRVPVRIYLLRGLRSATETGGKRRVLNLLERLTAYTSTTVLAVSESLRAEFLREGLSQQDKVIVLGSGSSNGVEIAPLVTFHVAETSTDLRAMVGLDPNVPTIGFVGRLAADKGLPTLLRAIQQLDEQKLFPQILLVGPDEPEGSLQTFLKEAGVRPNRVKWLGAVADVRPYYPLMDVLCLPTLREGFPNVVLEAGVNAVPTVASRVTGCVDAVIDGETGRLFIPGASGDLAQTLAELLRDPELRHRLGDGARQRAVKLFDRRLVWELTEAYFGQQMDTGKLRRVQLQCES